MTRNAANLMKRRFIPGCIAALILLVLAGLVPTASADNITWTLSGVTFSGGGTASGSFVYNVDTGLFRSVNITVGGSAFGDGTYSIATADSPTLFVFVPSGETGSLIGDPVVAFIFASSLTDAGGTIDLTLSDGQFDCSNSTCGTASLIDTVTGGEVVSSSVATPEPSSLLLLGTGLLGLLALAARSKLHAPPTSC